MNIPSLYDSSRLETNIVGPYQNSDRRIIDYRQIILGGEAFRGPLPDRMYSDEKLAFAGAAQTFGRFVRVPFPTMLGSVFNLDVLNLGYAGVGASFYLSRPYLLHQLSMSKAVVIQVMSGRSTANSVFDAPGGRNTLVRRSDRRSMTDGPAYRWLLETEGAAKAIAVIRETQERWVEETRTLAAAIQTRKILFWFSPRGTDFTPTGDSVSSLMGEFPHLVSTEMIDSVRDRFDDYVECVSQRGLPNRLIDRFTGEAVEVNFAGSRRTENRYYPSPEMHLDATHALEEPLRKVLAR